MTFTGVMFVLTVVICQLNIVFLCRRLAKARKQADRWGWRVHELFHENKSLKRKQREFSLMYKVTSRRLGLARKRWKALRKAMDQPKPVR